MPPGSRPDTVAAEHEHGVAGVGVQGAAAGRASRFPPAVQLLLDTSRSAGNQAVGRLLRSRALQRQPPTTAPPPPTSSDLNQRFQQQMTAGDFDAAARTLNQFSDADMAAEIGALSRDSRVRLFISGGRAFLLDPPPNRVCDAIYAADPGAARDGRIAYFQEVVTASDWRRAALVLNGFNDPDIRAQLTPLNPRQLAQIRDAAVQHMPGWNSRVVGPIHDILQGAVAGEMGGMVGQQATWVPSGPTSGNTFQTWASAATEAAAPPLTGATTINCWEMVLLAGYRTGAISWQWIHDLYTASAAATGGDWYGYLVRRLTPAGRRTYNRGAPAPRPARGDIVFWNGAEHVGLAVGTRDGTGREQVYSFWPPPGQPSFANTLDKVKVTTIEELADYMQTAFGSAPVVEFGPAPW